MSQVAVNAGVSVQMQGRYVRSGPSGAGGEVGVDERDTVLSLWGAPGVILAYSDEAELVLVTSRRAETRSRRSGCG